MAEKQDASDAYISAYADGVAMKEPISSDSKTNEVEQVLHDDGNIASGDSDKQRA